MLSAIIEYNGNTLVIEFPCDPHLMADHLGSIGIRNPANEIKCMDEEDEPIKVKIFGNSEFENKVASFISPTDTLSLVNTMCEIYQNLPYQNKLDAMDAVMSGKVSSVAEFDKFILDSRMEDTTEYFYCPLIANVYSRDEYGNMEDYPDEYDGSYLVPYEERIRDLILLEDARDEDNLAAYFDGSNGAVGKLKEIHFGTQNVDGVLYGCIRAELTAPFTVDEDAEFKDWLEGQCSDGFGEGLEQRSIRVEDGDMYVSFWDGGDDWFMLNGDEFDEYLSDQKMGCVE